MKNINKNMLHMKLKMAVCSAALLAFLPTSAFAGVCFLPDCSDEDLAGGGGNMDLNEDTAFCESKGFTYYASGKCPQYYAVVGTCNRDDHYLKCDAQTWCKQNGYNTTSCSIPNYVDQPCPSYSSLYKGCKRDNDRACKETGFTKTCPSGQKLKKNSGRCSYDSSYGTCCKPSGCPAYTSLTSSSYGTNGTDGCEYACYYTCNMNCPSGTSTSNPGGCGGSTRNGCNTKTCYYPYQSCCTPYSDESGCSCGTYSCSDGCSGTRKCCSACPKPEPDTSGANTQDCSSGYYRANGEVTSIHNGEEAIASSGGWWCFPLADRWLDSELTGISRRLIGVFQMRGTYNFTGDPYINEIEYSNGTIINGNISVGNIYAHSGTITFNGHVTVMNTVLIASGANVYFKGGVTFRGHEVGSDHCSNNWTGWGDSGSGRCNISGTRYY